MTGEVYVLGGAQNDFARNLDREGGGLFELFRDVTEAAFAATGIEPKQVQTAHVGNFAGELFSGQGQLGGFWAMSILTSPASPRRVTRPPATA